MYVATFTDLKPPSAPIERSVASFDNYPRRCRFAVQRAWVAAELLYDAELRVGKLAALNVGDVDLVNRFVPVLGIGE